MAKLVWLLFGLVVVVQGLSVKKANAEVKGVGKDAKTVSKAEAKLKAKPLQWPNQYTLKAKRMSLTDNVIEDYSIWKTSKQSRIDFNNGYVKIIVNAKSKEYRYGVGFQIRPEATLDQDVITVCDQISGNRWNQLEPVTILPDTDGFEEEVEETMNDKECTKFTYDFTDTEMGTDTESTLWATYDDSEKSWIPVRYEVLEFNSWLGAKGKHEIWDFYEFDKNFSFRKVFSVDDYGCDEKASLTSDSEAVTKHLLFVNPDINEHVNHVFNSFKTTHKREYSNATEHEMRKSLFRRSMRQVIQHNRQNKGYKMAINQFADRTPEEMKRYMGLMRRPAGKVGTVPFPYDEDTLEDISNEVPKELDLRLLGLVSNVKNQEDCGSCWTYGTTGAVEGALARTNGGRLMALSNQAIVDCAWAFGAYGCGGGTDNAAYEWMMEYGIPTVAEYGEYTNKDGECHIKNMTTTFKIRGYTDVTPLSVGALKVAALNHGPLSVSVHVTDSFAKYSSGIFYDTECNQLHLNHEVTLVGYGERDGDTFWILKNSWGPHWGIGGYMYISARDNTCGVATEPTYVVF